MMKRTENFLARWGLNCLGFGLLVLALIVGPFPGPGGTPLILAGLGILSINNEWAIRLRKYLIDHHRSVSTILFPANAWMIFLWDVVGAVFLGGGLSLAINVGGRWGYILASPLLTIALLIWASNHRRGQRIAGWCRHHWRQRRQSAGSD